MDGQEKTSVGKFRLILQQASRQAARLQQFVYRTLTRIVAMKSFQSHHPTGAWTEGLPMN